MRVVVSVLIAEHPIDIAPVFLINWFTYLLEAIIGEPTVISLVLILESDVVLLIAVAFDHTSAAILGGPHCQNSTLSPFAEEGMLSQDI